MTNDFITISYSPPISEGIKEFKKCAKEWQDDYDSPYPGDNDYQGWVEYAIQVIGKVCPAIPKAPLKKHLPKAE